LDYEIKEPIMPALDRAILHSIPSIDGYVLVVKGEDADSWHIGWEEIFGRKKTAETFAREHHWSGPWKAIRASLSVTIPPPKRKS
jgi:hypothetical protein